MNLAVNTFGGGLNMDIDPLSGKSSEFLSTLTNCLNGTYLTFNGHDAQIQNDMGNGRVETAKLPEGYVPIGTTSFGGIIYIVSYNPLNDQCQIGCFPSPERNFTYDETYGGVVQGLTNSDFVNSSNVVILNKKKIKLTTFKLNPGDKYCIYSKGLDNNITDYGTFTSNSKLGDVRNHLRLRIGTLDSSNKLVYLDSNVKSYSNNFYLQDTSNVDNDINIEDYDIYNSKLSGEIYLIAELEEINQFNYSYELTKTSGTENTYYFTFTFHWSDEYFEDGVYIGPDVIYFLDGSGNSREIKVTSHTKDETGYYFTYAMEDYTFQNSTTENERLSYSLTPWMSYGKLNNLQISDSIRLDLLGTGETEIDTWKYFKSDEYLSLSYGFADYPQEKYKTYGIELKFYNIEDILTTQQLNGCPYYSFKNEGANSYSNVFSANISFGTAETTEDNLKTELEADKLYYVEILKSYDSENYIYNNDSLPEYNVSVGHRFLYTNTVFNDMYLDSTIEDFNELKISLDNIDIECNTDQNISVESTTSDVVSNTNLSGSTNNYYTTTTGNGTITLIPSAEFTSDLFNLSLAIEQKNSNITTLETDTTSIASQADVTGTSFSLKQNKLDPTKYSVDYVFKNEMQATEYREENISYAGSLRPVLYTESDAALYGLSYDNGHFQLGSFITFGNEGKMRTTEFTYHASTDGGSDYQAYLDPNDDSDGSEIYSNTKKGTSESMLVATGTRVSKLNAFIDGIYPSQTIIPVTFVSGIESTNDKKEIRAAAISAKNKTKGDESVSLIRIEPSDGNITSKTDSGNYTSRVPYNSDVNLDSEHRNIFWSYVATNTYQSKNDDKLAEKLLGDCAASKNSGYEVTKDRPAGLGGLIFKSTNGLNYITNNFFYQFSRLGRGLIIGNTDFTPGDLVGAFLTQIYRYQSSDDTVQLLKYLPDDITGGDISYKVNLPIKINGTLTFKYQNLYTSLKNYLGLDDTTNDLNNIIIDTTISKEDTLTFNFDNPDLITEKCSQTTSDKLLIYLPDSIDPIEKTKLSIPLNTKYVYVMNKSNDYKTVDSLIDTDLITKSYTWNCVKGNGEGYSTETPVSKDYFRYLLRYGDNDYAYYTQFNSDFGENVFICKFNEGLGLLPRGIDILTMDDGVLKISDSKYRKKEQRTLKIFHSGKDTPPQQFSGFVVDFNIGELFGAHPCE